MKAGKMSASQPIALQLDQVSRRFGRQEVLVDVSLSVPRGGITCLLVPTGTPGMVVDEYLWTFNMPTDHPRMHFENCLNDQTVFTGQPQPPAP